jgi:predicted nucleic acid-binding protein
MSERSKPPTRLPGTTCAVSNTGPLISVFQSDSFSLLARVFAAIHIPVACVVELDRHGWEEEIQVASSRLVVVRLTGGEEKRAMSFAEQIAQHPDSTDPVAENHLGEAQAIVLALRSAYRQDLLLLDELAARAVARQAGVRISGFPGVLLLASRSGLISAEDLKARLETCREEGTHYGVAFVEQVYDMARRGRRRA